MSKLEDFEDISYEDEKTYTPKELEEYIKIEKDNQKKEMDCAVSQMKEEVKALQIENEFYKNIIKSVLHIKE